MSQDEHREFETGAIRDSEANKEDYIETISWSAFKRYAQYMTGKKQKYGAGNFKKGIPIDSYERSLVRHLQKYMENKYEGGKIEVEEDHLSAMLFNIFGIMHEESQEVKKVCLCSCHKIYSSPHLETETVCTGCFANHQ